MFLFFLFLYSFLFSKDIGILMVLSTTTLNNICQYTRDNNIKLSVSYAGKISNPCDYMDIEEVEYIRFPIGLAFSKGDSGVFSRSFDLPLNKELFDCIYHKYVSSVSARGVFIESASFFPQIIDFLPSTVSWISGGIVENKPSFSYILGGKNIVVFEVIRSTSQLYFSSSSLFLLDERVFKGDIIDFLTNLSLNDIKVFKISDVISSVLTSTENLQFSSYVDFLSVPEKNFLSYLNRVGYNVFIRENSLEFVNSYFCDLISYYPPPVEDTDEFYENVRNITSELYSIISVDVPMFVYNDFLKDNVNSFSIERGSTYLKYISDNGYFSVNTDENNVYFTVEFSTMFYNDEIHIYADMNRRVGQGNQFMISKKEKIDDKAAWEYAFIINNKNIKFYTSSSRDYKFVKEFTFSKKDNNISFSIPLKIFTGNPITWRYIVVFLKDDEMFGFLKRVYGNIITTPDD